MHRFRKWSDAKNSPPSLRLQTQSIHSQHSQYSHQQQEEEKVTEIEEHHDLLPVLPSADDFRTSLILPDLSRRFSLLRDSSGDPLSVDALRSRLAHQRAKGAENHISEEEEDMILETLGLRPKTPQSAERSQENLVEGSPRQSVRSTNTAASASSAPSTPTRPSKRYSNNLFGSGRLREYSYARLTSTARSSVKSRADSPTKPELRSPNTVSQNEEIINPSHATLDDPAMVESALTTPVDQVLPSSDSQFAKPSVYKRASLALAQAIRELEEDGEDEVVMPRSAPLPRHGLDSVDNNQARPYHQYEQGMAISSDNSEIPDEESSMSPILVRKSAGYVPGMPRPVTPHDDLEQENLRSHSTTPRAHSPSASTSSTTPPSRSISGVLSSGSSSAPRLSTRPTSPLSTSVFLERKRSIQNGDKERPVGDSSSSSGSSAYSWGRPSSPPVVASQQPNASQRPGTPSNVTWTFPSNKTSPRKGVHTRGGSWFSDTGETQDSHYEPPSVTRLVHSPALPDSPIMGPSHTNMMSFTYPGSSEMRPMSPMSGLDMGAPSSPVNRVIRSPTPTQTPSRSPTSPTFSGFEISSKGSRRSSKQNSSSHFSLPAFNSVVFSPLLNSSRSSLASVGSSYHSDGDRDDRLASFVDVDTQEPVWHDISFPSHSSDPTTPADSPNFEDNAEQIIIQYGGINKSDISTIQEKLVGFALAKQQSISEVRERVPSLRRRRPSTSQSNYSFTTGRIASPPPQTQSTTVDAEQLSPKASALLQSVVESIQGPIAPLEDNGDVSPTTRRNRDLAQVLFGADGDFQESPFTAGGSSNTTDYLHLGLESTTPEPEVRSPEDHLGNTASTPRHPESELAREVQRKAEAAMMALRKNSSKDGFGSTTSLPRKRIAPHQISTPTLVSASTSVDTIPLRSPPISVQQSSKLGSRFKKLRGTLRKNTPVPNGDEVTPFPTTSPIEPPTPSQTIQYDPRKLHPIAGVATSATELGGFNVPMTPVAPLPSPPASAGPGLKGFMARFRGKQRTAEPVIHERRETPIRTVREPSDAMPPPVSPAPEYPTSTPTSPRSVQPSIVPMSPSFAPARSPSPPPTDDQEQAALRQLFDAASNLGLDHKKLRDLVRSGSISSKSDWGMLAQSNSTSRPQTASPEHIQVQTTIETMVTLPVDTDGEDAPETPISRKPSTRQNADAKRKLRERTVEPRSQLVRRTIVYPSEFKEALPPNIAALASKGSVHRRRGSATSMSSRSVHERVPTPPPNRASLNRRVSADTPPVPPISPLVANYPSVFIPPPPPNNERYESMYGTYGDGQLQESSQRNTTMLEAGQGIEVLQYANGETIWQIVNGLRDEDAESMYNSRGSFASEFDNDESVQLYFKEQNQYGGHQRSGSKGSTSSFLSRKKSNKATPNANAQRPKTKMFFSSSANIVKLIDDLSSGLDAATFNIVPGDATNTTGYSVTSSMQSEAEYTIEERLERMLGRLERGES